MKNLIVILTAILFLTGSVSAQDAAVSFPDTTLEPGTEVLLPLNITNLDGVGSSSIFFEYDPAVLTYIGVENSSFPGVLANDLGGEVRTSWFSLAPVNLSDKVFDVRFLYNGGSSDLVLSFVQLTNALSQPYELEVFNGSVGDGLSSIELTSPAGGEEWLAGTVQNITYNSSGVDNVSIEYSFDGGLNYNTVVASTPATGTYEWTVPHTPTDEAVVRVSNVDDGSVYSLNESVFTLLTPPAVGDIPDQTVGQCESFELIRLDEFVNDDDNNDNEILWTVSGGNNLAVSIDENRNALVTAADPEWSGTETLTFTATDPNGESASDDVVLTVTEVNSPPELTCPPEVTLDLLESTVTLNGPAAVATDFCDAEPVVTSEPALPVTYDTPGEYTITWTATDLDGNSASCVQNVIVNERPALVVDAGKDKAVTCGESVEIGGSPTAKNGLAPYTYSWAPAEGLDDVSSPNPVANPLTTTVYTVTVTDADGAVLTDQVTVAFSDTEAPELVCPADQVLEITAASSVVYSGPAAEASDNCEGAPVVTSEPALPVTYDSPGEYTIIWTAVDASGNSTTCEQKITVTVETTLVVDAGQDQTVSCSESVELGGSPTAVEGQEPYTYKWTPADGLDDPASSNPVASPLETTTYTVKVTDDWGGVVTDEVTVTVSDTEAPVVVCPDNQVLEFTLYSPAVYSGPAATASDNCDNEPVVTSEPELPLSYTQAGEYTITWTATDASGNSSSCEQRITVEESDVVYESNLAKLTLIHSQLLGINTGVKKLDDKLRKSADKLESSLDLKYWIDENRLEKSSGKKVFDNGKKAVKDMAKIRKDKNADEDTKVALENMILDLLGVYQSIARIAIEEDEASCFDDACVDVIAARYAELRRAGEEIAEGRYDKAVDRYRNAWGEGKKGKNKKKKDKKNRKELSGDNSELAENTPSVSTLEQNYPNPFNPSTLISFSLPEAGPVKLIVYNAIGEEIEVLVNGTYSAGSHTVQFNAANLNAGLYLYRLETADFVSIRKMVLLK